MKFYIIYIIFPYQASFKKHTNKWTKQHQNIRKLLMNPKIRDLNEQMDYDYEIIPEEWADSLEAIFDVLYKK